MTPEIKVVTVKAMSDRRDPFIEEPIKFHSVPAPTTRHWPDGIDYETWAQVVKPSPRDAFADSLDIIDLDEDERA
jgi:hypothetical protein